MEKLELKASIEALIYNWLKFDTETIDIASGMREETNFYVNERTNGFRVVMEYPIGYNDVQGGDIGEIVGVMEYDRDRKFWGQADDGEMRVASDAASTTAQEMKILKQVLSQSTPLTPEIEKAWETCSKLRSGQNVGVRNKTEYISNLKLDI